MKNIAGVCAWCGYKYVRVIVENVNCHIIQLFKKSKKWKYKRKESVGMLVTIDPSDGSIIHL